MWIRDQLLLSNEVSVWGVLAESNDRRLHLVVRDDPRQYLWRKQRLHVALFSALAVVRITSADPMSRIAVPDDKRARIKSPTTWRCFWFSLKIRDEVPDALPDLYQSHDQKKSRKHPSQMDTREIEGS